MRNRLNSFVFTVNVTLALIFQFSVKAGDFDSVIINDNGPQESSFKPYADFRFRYEADWDSVNSAGDPRDDRHRLRIRTRVGFKYEPDSQWLIEMRARTGNSKSQQSPHLTIHDFNEGDRNDFDGFLDKYYVKNQISADSSVWVGRNGFPFWKQNELFWDDDVTVTGAAINSTWDTPGSGELTGNLGAFYLPDGGWNLNGQLFAGQLVYQRSLGEFELTWAEGFYFMNGESGAHYLINENGARDYAILGNQVKLSRELLGIPFQLGADTYFNFKEYSSASDPFSEANADEDFGYVLSATMGRLAEKGDVQFGYYYAHIETLAVNASYAQDDWVRWGSATQTTSSDLKGHELRLTYRALPTLDIMARMYMVDAITSGQDGTRFRVDFNYKF